MIAVGGVQSYFSEGIYDTLQSRNHILLPKGAGKRMKISSTVSPGAARPKAPDMTGDKRKARIVMATDSEWQIIGERAETARMSTSSFIVDRAIATTQMQSDDSLPTPLCRRVARDVLALARVEELRYQQTGESGAWEEIVAAAEATIKAEETAGH